jgi:hypothetical protein
MDNWQATFFGLKQLPRELTAFEIEALDPTLTAPGYEEVIFTDATTTCVWRVEGRCI